MTAPTDNTTQQRGTLPVVAAAPLAAPVPAIGLVGHAEALQSILSDVSTLTISQLVQLFRQYGAQPDFPATLYAAFPEIVRPHAQAAAQITAQWYDELNPQSVYQANPIVDLPGERIDGTIDWALHAPTYPQSPVEPAAPTEAPVGSSTPDPQTVLDRLSGSAQRMVQDASRSTVIENAKTEHVKWARYASATACAFCRILATRGAVYSSEQSALKSHDHCRCLALPLRGGEMWTPPAYVGQWEKDYNAAREAGHTSPKAILSHMRANTDAR